jgi:hypothetical protein
MNNYIQEELLANPDKQYICNVINAGYWLYL